MSSDMSGDRMVARTLEARSPEELDQVADTIAHTALKAFSESLAGRELPVMPAVAMKPYYYSAASFQSSVNLRVRGAK